MKKIFLGISGFLIFFAGGENLLFSQTFASGPPPISSGLNMLPGPRDFGGESSTEGTKYLREELLPKVSNFLLIVIFMLASAAFVLAGVIYIFGFGDTTLNTRAKGILLWSVIGVGVAALSWAFVRIFIQINWDIPDETEDQAFYSEIRV